MIEGCAVTVMALLAAMFRAMTNPLIVIGILYLRVCHGAAGACVGALAGAIAGAITIRHMHHTATKR